MSSWQGTAPGSAQQNLRPAGVSAAFIKELMRRAVQYHIEAAAGGKDGELALPEVNSVQEEIFFGSGR